MKLVITKGLKKEKITPIKVYLGYDSEGTLTLYHDNSVKGITSNNKICSFPLIHEELHCRVHDRQNNYIDDIYLGKFKKNDLGDLEIYKNGDE